MATFGRGPIWPDVAGTATQPTEAHVLSSRVLEIREEGELACRAVVTGVACRAIQLDVQVATDGATYGTVLRKTILGAAVGTHQATLRLPTPCLARVSARGWGIDADTRLVIHADARTYLGEQDLSGQPLDLAGHQAAGIECWGDGAGAAVAMAIGPAAHVPEPQAAANQQWLPTGDADTLVIDWTAATNIPVTVELLVRERSDGVNVVEQPAVNSVIAGIVTQQIAQDQIVFGALGTRRSREISVRPGTEVLILAQYTGAAGAPDGYGVARFYRYGQRA